MTLPDLDYRGLFDASPNPYLVLDRALHIVGANRAYLAATKRRLEDIVGRWAWDAFPTDPETLKQSVASFERVIRTRQPDIMALLRFDIPRPAEEGGGFEVRYWTIIHTPVLDENGEVALLLQHPIDVTELQLLRESARAGDLGPAVTGIVERARSVHEANLALKADSDRLRDLFAHAPSPIAVLAGPAHVFELANEAFGHLAGGRDLLGKPLLAALPELAGQGLDTLLDEAYAGGKPYVGRGRPMALRSWPDALPRELYHDVLFQPLAGPDGKVYGIFCQLHDVTEAYQAQAALRESRERLQEGMDAARMVVWDWDIPSGRLKLSANAAQILGGHWDEVKALFRAVHPGDREAMRRARRRATREQPRYAVEFRFIRPDNGQTLWLETRAQVLFSEEGVSRYVKGVTLDISERKGLEEKLVGMNAALETRVEESTAELRRANAALALSNRELQQFAYISAHDLQTPLRAISGFAQLLRRDYRGRLDARADSWLERLVEAVARMHRLIGDVLAYSRIDSRGGDFQPVDCQALWDEAVAALAGPIRDNGAQVSREVLPVILGDRGQLAQVLEQLLDNAIKYRGEQSPRVHGSARRQGEEWLFSVRDNGIGIAPRHRERIFDIFQRLHTHSRYPGTGIGLAICRRIIHRHGGRIWVEGAPGQGSIFCFTLPARPSEGG